MSSYKPFLLEIFLVLDAIMSSQHRANGSFHDNSSCTYLVATTHLQLCKPAPVPAANQLCNCSTRWILEQGSWSNAEIYVCFCLQIHHSGQKRTNLVWEDRLWSCCCELFISVSLLSGLPLCLTLYLTWFVNAKLPKAKNRLYLHLSTLDAIQGFHILCYFTFYQAFVLHTEKEVLSHCTP